ncbi:MULTISPECIES: hypothetical protein [Exiguobacterium]|uniref:hypothetical protein n=1 Tax=Exiguobacterium TaxID=33986 RepID=UPI001BECA0D4|nr:MULTISPECIES: hypothetical protein [Exiguobacterium]MCT4781944.1 hypothetical protein [Exiguobacterium himgiriensis]
MTMDAIWANRPTLLWEERLNDGDDMYTLSGIRAVDAALHQYVTTLSHSDGTETSIRTAVRDLVLRLNELDEAYDYFIETMEREELYDFIKAGAALVGYETEDDMTEEWREW